MIIFNLLEFMNSQLSGPLKFSQILFISDFNHVIDISTIIENIANIKPFFLLCDFQYSYSRVEFWTKKNPILAKQRKLFYCFRQKSNKIKFDKD